LKEKPNNSFILRRSNSDILKSLSITYKNEDGKIFQLKIRKTEEKLWYTLWEDDEGETIDMYAETIEEMVQKIMIDNGYKFN
jgi:hypothetical protein